MQLQVLHSYWIYWAGVESTSNVLGRLTYCIGQYYWRSFELLRLLDYWNRRKMLVWQGSWVLKFSWEFRNNLRLQIHIVRLRPRVLLRFKRYFRLKEIGNMFYSRLIFIEDILFVFNEPFVNLPTGNSFLLICMTQKNNNSFKDRINSLYLSYSFMFLL